MQFAPGEGNMMLQPNDLENPGACHSDGMRQRLKRIHKAVLWKEIEKGRRTLFSLDCRCGEQNLLKDKSKCFWIRWHPLSIALCWMLFLWKCCYWVCHLVTNQIPYTRTWFDLWLSRKLLILGGFLPVHLRMVSGADAKRSTALGSSARRSAEWNELGTGCSCSYAGNG